MSRAEDNLHGIDSEKREHILPPRMFTVSDIDVEGQLSIKRAELEDAILTQAMLKKEIEKLEIALGVVRNLGSVDARAFDWNKVAGVVENEATGKKPSGTPTMPEMIMQMMVQHNARGQGGVEPKDITDEIRKKWWPNAPSQSVGPIMWRLVERRRLIKRDGLYYLPEDEAPAEAPAEASERERDAGYVDLE